jgi:hypothetical protein
MHPMDRFPKVTLPPLSALKLDVCTYVYTHWYNILFAHYSLQEMPTNFFLENWKGRTHLNLGIDWNIIL